MVTPSVNLWEIIKHIDPHSSTIITKKSVLETRLNKLDLSIQVFTRDLKNKFKTVLTKIAE